MDNFSQKDLLQLLEKRRQGPLLPEEHQLLEEWFARLHATDEHWYKDETDKTQQLELLWQSIQDQTDLPQLMESRSRSISRWWWWAAAAGTGIAFSLWLMIPKKSGEPLAVRQASSPVQQIPPVPSQTVSAALGTVKKITLPDNSVVWLNSGATLRYPEKFAGAERSIALLSGQAFFQITKDSLHPFIVHSDGLQIQVLGTSFEIIASKDKQFVSVATGKVKVSKGDTVELGRLIPGKKLTYTNKDDKAIISAVNQQKVAGWRSRRIELENASFAILAETLETIYGVQVKAGDGGVTGQTYTITLQYGTSLKDITTILATIHNNDYSIKNNTVTFKTKEP